jgi:hypothetical protein
MIAATLLQSLRSISWRCVFFGCEEYRRDQQTSPDGQFLRFGLFCKRCGDRRECVIDLRPKTFCEHVFGGAV